MLSTVGEAYSNREQLRNRELDYGTGREKPEKIAIDGRGWIETQLTSRVSNFSGFGSERIPASTTEEHRKHPVAAKLLNLWLSRSGAPGTTRTCDLLIRSQTLYPTELRVHFVKRAIDITRRVSHCQARAITTLTLPKRLSNQCIEPLRVFLLGHHPAFIKNLEARARIQLQKLLGML